MSTFPTGRRLRGSLTGVAVAAMVRTTAACGGTTRGPEEASSTGGGDDAGASADPGAEIPADLAIAFLPEQVDNPYFDVAAAGAETAVGEFEGELDVTGPSEASASSQVSSINTLTQQGADAILTSANDPNAICSALDQARSAGAAVVTFDSDTSPECRDLFIDRATPEGIAQSPDRHHGGADRRRGPGGHPVGHRERHEPEHLDLRPFQDVPTGRTTNVTNPVISELIQRSNRLGADPRNTNYAGGNTSAKGSETDPVTGQPVDLLWVKGSGGDLGTLRETGLAVLRLDRLRSLVDVYPGVEREDEMVAAFDFCLHGRGGAAPSIDTAMHGLVEAAHVDHLHPDSGIALATAADGEALTRECFGDRVVWVPWRRPGFQLGLDIAAIKDKNPQAIGCILGGHGVTAWGETSEQCEANSLEIIRTAERFLGAKGKAEPFGAVVPGFEALPEGDRRRKAAALAPVIRGLASTDKPQVGHFTDSDVVLEFLSREKLQPLAALGTSCPDHFLRTKVRPMVLDLPASAPVEDVVARLGELHEEYRAEYAAYYSRHATPDSPPMRGADPAIVLVPGVGMFSFGANKQTARVAGEFYVNAINVMRGAEAVSAYAPIDESEKFRIEYWALEEAKLQRMPKPTPLATRVALVTGAASGIGKAIAERLAAEGACVVVADLDLQKAQDAAAGIGSSDVAIGVAADVSDAEAVAAAFRAANLAFGGVDLVVNNAGLSISKPLLETTEQDWDLQHDVMAKGSFLVSREAARIMIEQGLGGDIVYISSKNSIFAGPNNLAYGSTKADQAHQVRLLAAELGPHQIRVNGINPDGVVRGSGIFAGGWGASRAAVYGVEEEKLGEFYAQRTLLKREVLPDHVADAVFALTGGDLTRTTGLHVPVDSGVAAAFLR